jgi:hypothetical protein
MRQSPWIVMLLTFAAGCGPAEDVRHYRAPKDSKWRMLAAIAPGKDATWFFKAVASTDLVESHKGEVLSFLRTLRLEEGQVRWSAPPGWQEEKGSPERLATYRIGERDPRLELSITRLAGDGGGLASNVSRWRDQLGLDAQGPAQIEATLQTLPATGLELRVVDLSGPNRPGMMGSRAPVKPAEPPREAGDRAIDFELPPGWVENPKPAKNRLLEFTVEDPAGSATVTLTALEGDAGGLEANIDRWRSQVGLEPLGDQAVARSATPIQFLGTESWFVEAIGGSRSILGVIAKTPAGTVFLKMDGPTAAVTAQRSAFGHFAQTFKIRGHHD